MPHLTRLALVPVLAWLATLPTLASPAQAQAARGPGRGTAYAGVAKSCAPEARRLCPSLDADALQPRGMAICLRPYKSSLSLPCRHAVQAVSR